MDLQKLRKEIDEIDGELLTLFLRRMKVAEEVAAYKMEHDLPIYNPHREEEILKQVEKQAGEYAEYARKYFQELMNLSKERQEEIIHG